MKTDILLKSLFDNQISFTYARPDEVALAKKIDIKYLSFIKGVIKANKLKIRIRYRGPSHPFQARPQSFCHMNIATSFALYLR